MSSTIRCAYLRVYSPLTSLSPLERKRVEAALRAPARIGAAELRRHGLGLLEPDERHEAYELEHEGERMVCPSHTRLRALIGMMAFERSLPDGVAPLFFRPGELDDGRRELESMRTSEPSLRPCVVQSPWHVPLQWFVCFDDAERRIEQSDDHLRIRYRTPMRTARERTQRAVDALSGGTVHPSIVGSVYELHGWLGGFELTGVLELDYASVSMSFEDDELADDHSASDVWSAIYALADGDGMKAGLYYQRARERWSGARGRESLN